MLSCFSPVQLFGTLWTVALQAPLCGIFQARILEWVAMPTPGDLSNPGIQLVVLMTPTLAGRFFTTRATWEAHK